MAVSLLLSEGGERGGEWVLLDFVQEEGQEEEEKEKEKEEDVRRM